MHKPLCASLTSLEADPKYLLHLPHSGKCHELAPYIVAVSVASQIARCKHMRDSAIAHSVPLVIIKNAFKYTTQRFAALIPVADAVHPETVLLNVDCYDILFLASGDEILRRFHNYGRTFVIGAEKGAFPDSGSSLVAAYRSQGPGVPVCEGSALKYANCGAFATTMAGMREMMDWMASKYPSSRCLCNYLQTAECAAETTLANDQACMHRFVLAHWNRTALDCGGLILNLFRTACKHLQFRALSAGGSVHVDLGLVITKDAMQQGGLVLHASGKSKSKLDALRCCAGRVAQSSSWSSMFQASADRSSLLMPGCCC